MSKVWGIDDIIPPELFPEYEQTAYFLDPQWWQIVSGDEWEWGQSVCVVCDDTEA